MPVELSTDNAVALVPAGNMQEVLEAAETHPKSLSRIEAVATMGRAVAVHNELDYSTGVIAEEIEILRNGIRRLEILIENEFDSKEKANLIDKQGRHGVHLSDCVRRLNETAKLSRDRKENNKRIKATSFTPRMAVNVQVNGATSVSTSPVVTEPEALEA